VQALAQIDQWPVDNAAAAIVSLKGVAGTHGDGERPFRWASVTKVFTGAAVLVAAEEGILDLDEPAGPKGSTVRHLLAHASGLPFEGTVPIGRPGERRIYSNAGFDALGDLVAARAEMPFADYLRGAVLEPLGLPGAELRGRPSEGLRGPVDDLARFGQELLSPSFLAAETLAEATTVAFPGLNGIVPGIGRYEPNDWGLGFELKNGKEPHWTGSANSARTFGHFGGAGAFLWVDPEAGVALACLSDRQFGDWALEAWPLLSDAVLADGPGV
jgi:CubicO group peptidase (beta-lactamase class C family)